MFKGKGQVKKESAQQALLKGPAATTDAASSPPSFLRRRKGAMAAHPLKKNKSTHSNWQKPWGSKTQRPKEREKAEEASLC